MKLIAFLILSFFAGVPTFYLITRKEKSPVECRFSFAKFGHLNFAKKCRVYVCLLHPGIAWRNFSTVMAGKSSGH
jgi:hypothetical protein